MCERKRNCCYLFLTLLSDLQPILINIERIFIKRLFITTSVHPITIIARREDDNNGENFFVLLTSHTVDGFIFVGTNFRGLKKNKHS